MAIDNSFMIKKFQKFEKLAVLYSAATQMPFVVCDEESFEDQVYVFTRDEDLQQYAKIFTKENYPLRAMQLTQQNFGQLFNTLYAMDIDTIVVTDEGAPVKVHLADLAEPPKADGTPDPRIPMMNPRLQISALYFLQELRKIPGGEERTIEEKRRLHDLEEEMAVNLMRSDFIVSFDISQVKGKWDPTDRNAKVRVPFVRTKKGQVFQPVYTDYFEFQKFNVQSRNRMKMGVTTASYEQLQKLLTREAEAFVFNPAGFNLVLKPEQMKQMKEMYGE